MTAIHVGMPGIQGHQSGTQVSFISLFSMLYCVLHNTEWYWSTENL